MTRQSTVTTPLLLQSKLGHCSIGTAPSAMLTPITSSSTVTSSLPLQSPTQLPEFAVEEGVGVEPEPEGVAEVSVRVAVAVGDNVGGRVRVAVGVVVTLAAVVGEGELGIVGVGLGVGVGVPVGARSATMTVEVVAAARSPNDVESRLTLFPSPNSV